MKTAFFLICSFGLFWLFAPYLPSFGCEVKTEMTTEASQDKSQKAFQANHEQAPKKNKKKSRRRSRLSEENRQKWLDRQNEATDRLLDKSVK